MIAQVDLRFALFKLYDIQKLVSFRHFSSWSLTYYADIKKALSKLNIAINLIDGSFWRIIKQRQPSILSSF